MASTQRQTEATHKNVYKTRQSEELPSNFCSFVESHMSVIYLLMDLDQWELADTIHNTQIVIYISVWKSGHELSL